MAQHSLSRTELLIGSEGLNKLKNSKVVVFGIGGVGSYSVEALARAGVGTLVLIDDDTVCLTNLNRQIHATYKTISRPKVDVMKERIEDINSQCNVITYQTFVTADNIPEILTKDIDYVIDAIDTVSSKIALAIYCEKNNIKLISSMGTGNKFDPTQFKVTDIFKTKVCPLAKVMRHELKRRGVKKLKVLYSEELPVKPKNEDIIIDREDCACIDENTHKTPAKRQTPGSMSFVPPAAGMILASVVVRDLLNI